MAYGEGLITVSLWIFSTSLWSLVLEGDVKHCCVSYNRAKVKSSNNSGRSCGGDVGMEKGGKWGAAEGYQQLWQLCGYGELSHNTELPGQECRTDQPDSGLCSGPPRHRTQQLPNPKLLPWYPTPCCKAQPGFWEKASFSLGLQMLLPVCVLSLCLDYKWQHTCQPQAQVVS